MADINDYTISLKQAADKAVKQSLRDAIAPALDAETDALRLDPRTLNRNRYRAVRRLDDCEALKDRAGEIKEESIEDLPELCSTKNRLHEETGRKEQRCPWYRLGEFCASICL